MPCDDRESYTGIRAVQARLGKQKLTPLPAEASEGGPGYGHYMAACVARFLELFGRLPSRNAACSRVGVPPPLACACCSL